jgi:pyruvate,water dikinase
MTVAHLFDERNVAVQRMVQLAIAAAKKCDACGGRSHRKIGICCQAPSDYPEFAQFLVE